MKTIDTCGTTALQPFNPCHQACARPEKARSWNHQDDAAAFNDMKEYLSEQQIGFREIYDGERMTLQFLMCK